MLPDLEFKTMSPIHKVKDLIPTFFVGQVLQVSFLVLQSLFLVKDPPNLTSY